MGFNMHGKIRDSDIQKISALEAQIESIKSEVGKKKRRRGYDFSNILGADSIRKEDFPWEF